MKRVIEIEKVVEIGSWSRDDYGVKHYNHKPIEDFLRYIKYEIEQAINQGSADSAEIYVSICSRDE